MSADYDKGFYRAVDAMNEMIQKFDPDYERCDPENTFEDFVDEVIPSHANKLVIDTYDSDGEDVAKGIRGALNQLQAQINKNEKPSGSITFRW